MHGFPGGDTVIERNGHVGHGAVLHGCRVGEDALIGMNAVVMDGAHVAPRCIVAATAFVKAGFSCAEQSLVVGSPAQVKRPLTDQELAWKQRGTAQYQELTLRCMATLVECPPLTEAEQDRPRMEDSGFRPKGKAPA
ncbi:Carnitine operon protein CaiE [compost metagenome]